MQSKPQLIQVKWATGRILFPNIYSTATGQYWDVGEWEAWSRDVMYTHKKAHKWVWRDWWDFKKLLEGISLGLFPTAPQCQSQSRRKDGSSKGRKKKYTPTAASQLKLNPFNYSPEVEAWGAKKKLSSIVLQERETPLPLQKYPFEALHMRLPGWASSSLVSVPI